MSGGGGGQTHRPRLVSIDVNSALLVVNSSRGNVYLKHNIYIHIYNIYPYLDSLHRIGRTEIPKTTSEFATLLHKPSIERRVEVRSVLVVVTNSLVKELILRKRKEQEKKERKRWWSTWTTFKTPFSQSGHVQTNRHRQAAAAFVSQRIVTRRDYLSLRRSLKMWKFVRITQKHTHTHAQFLNSYSLSVCLLRDVATDHKVRSQGVSSSRTKQ